MPQTAMSGSGRSPARRLLSRRQSDGDGRDRVKFLEVKVVIRQGL